MVQSSPVQRLKRHRTKVQLFYRKQKVNDAELDLIQLRNLYKGRKDIITPSVFSRLSPERQAEVLEEMLTAAREAAQRRAKIYRMLDNENSGERPWKELKFVYVIARFVSIDFILLHILQYVKWRRFLLAVCG